MKNYIERRQEQEVILRQKLNESLELVNGFEKVVILKGSELKKLNIEGLHEFITFINGLSQAELKINSTLHTNII